MNFILSTILSGLFYDAIKESCKITLNSIMDVFTHEIVDPSIDINYLNERIALAANNPVVIASDKEIDNILTNKIIYKTNFAKRLDYVISLMRLGGCETSVDELGEFLGYPSVNELKKHYITQEEPDYQKIEYIAEKLGVNKQWLKNGSQNVFKSDLNNDVYDDIVTLNPNMIYFVYSNIEYPYIGIVLIINSIKCIYLSQTYPFSSRVGGTGQSQIYTFYSLVKQLYSSELMVKCYARVVPEALFNNIFNGEVYSGIVQNLKYRDYQGKWLSGSWIDDFVDLSIKHRDNNLKEYGKAFVDCQDIIRYVENL